MGKDKFENEELGIPDWDRASWLTSMSLIKFAWEGDVWFHVDKLSSAHVYLRCPPGLSWDSIPEQLLADAAQLTKANSIEGNKKDNITIIYTPSSNLKKDGSMDTGQVSFHKSQNVRKILVKTRENVIINRLNKTKEVRQPDLEVEQREHVIQKQRTAKEHFMATKREEEKKAREQRALKEARDAGYSDFLTDEMIANASNDREDGYDPDDDFM